MTLTTQIHKAIIKSSVLHADQKRKCTDCPYVAHPYAVAFILSHYTKDEDIITAALLHDTLEDVPEYTFESIKTEFGERVAGIVQEVSEEKKSGSRQESRDSWERRKKGQLDKLEGCSYEAMMVCAADKIHNIHSLVKDYDAMGDKIWGDFNSSKARKMWFYGEIIKILKRRLKNDIVKELETAYKKAQDLFGDK